MQAIFFSYPPHQVVHPSRGLCRQPYHKAKPRAIIKKPGRVAPPGFWSIITPCLFLVPLSPSSQSIQKRGKGEEGICINLEIEIRAHAHGPRAEVGDILVRGVVILRTKTNTDTSFQAELLPEEILRAKGHREVDHVHIYREKARSVDLLLLIGDPALGEG